MSSAVARRTKLPQQCMTALVFGTALAGLGWWSGSASAATTVNDLSRYCTACWRNARLQPDYWPDCTQEVLLRLLEKVDPDRWDRVLDKETDERREFLRAIDAVKKRTLRAHRTGALPAEVADPASSRGMSIEEARASLLSAAAEHLSPRQQQIITLSLDGWNVREIAEEMKLPAARVSDEKYKAIQKLRGCLATPA